MKPKLFRVSTVALSLNFLLKGQLAFLNASYEVVGISGADEHLDEVSSREGIKTIDVPMQRAISPLNDLISLWRLYRLFVKEKPLIVHSITPKAGLLSMIAAYFAGVPIRMHTFTGLIFPSKTGFLQRLLIMMDKLLCRFATHIYPEGAGVRQDMIKFHITGKPLKVLANGNVNGIDTSSFRTDNFPVSYISGLKESLSIDESNFVFIFVGRLVADKGINELIMAFKTLYALNDKIRLLLVGSLESDMDPLSADTLSSIETHHGIISAGFQNDVRPYFAIADVLTFPSYREGFPNVVIQAGAMELPAIVTDINGSNEIIKQHKNGIIIPVKDEEQLYNAMLKMIEDRSLYHKLKSNARLMITSRYEQKLVWDTLLGEYQLLESEMLPRR